MHYANAPITEAIIDLRVSVPDGTDYARLKQIGEREQDTYPTQEEMFEAVGQMAVGPHGDSASVTRTPTGWKLISDDHRQIAQCRTSGFTFSRLTPYERWQSFRDEARRLWTIYRNIANPDNIARLAVRFINRIDIPGNSVDLKEYFRTSPEVSSELPQTLAGYFMQLRLPYPEIAGLCVITQTIIPPAKADVVSVVLDIDLFRSEDVAQEERHIWDFFETLHVAKNRIFEACITDASRRLFSLC